MIPPGLDATLVAVAAAEARLDATLDRLDDALAAGPSRLAGWTRAVLVRHIAVNAWTNAAMVEGALRGERVPQYAGGDDERERLIEEGRGKPAADVVADARAAAAHLAELFGRVDAERWDFAVPAGVGRRPLWDRVFVRWAEVEVHHVDLDLGYEPADWPADFAATTLRRSFNVLPDRVAGVPDDAKGTWRVDAGAAGAWDVELVPTATVERPVHPEITSMPPVVGVHAAHADVVPRGGVRGDARAVLAWLAGRGDAATLEISGDPTAASLPAWFPWS